MRAHPLCAAALLLATSATQAEPAFMHNGLVSLNFSRSGGLVALGNPPSGEVTIADGKATLRSEAFPAGRPLNPIETAMLDALDVASLRAWKPPANAGRDLRTLTITLRFHDGALVTLNFTDPPGGGAPGAQALATWAFGEAERVWQHRLSQ